MNYYQLLRHRAALLRQARLANLAFACARLEVYAQRLGRAAITGPLTLHPVDPAAERYCPVLVAHGSNQSMVDEFFLDEDVVDLAGVLSFLDAEGFGVEWTFTRDDLVVRWLPCLRHELEFSGVTPPAPSPPEERSSSGGAGDTGSARHS